MDFLIGDFLRGVDGEKLDMSAGILAPFHLLKEHVSRTLRTTTNFLNGKNRDKEASVQDTSATLPLGPFQWSRL